MNNIYYITVVTVQEEGQEHKHDESVTSMGIELKGNLDMRHDKFVHAWNECCGCAGGGSGARA